MSSRPPSRGKNRVTSRDARAKSDQIATEVAGIYRELESRRWERDCQARTTCCRFQLTGEIPQLTKGEALFLAKGVRGSGRRTVPTSPEGACPLLGQDGKCLVYAHRPFGCRTHFCAAAGGMLPRSGVIDLIRRLEVLDEKLGGNGPRALPVAVTDALAELS
jgi:uncharacterized protein